MLPFYYYFSLSHLLLKKYGNSYLIQQVPNERQESVHVVWCPSSTTSVINFRACTKERDQYVRILIRASHEGQHGEKEWQMAVVE